MFLFQAVSLMRAGTVSSHSSSVSHCLPLPGSWWGSLCACPPGRHSPEKTAEARRSLYVVCPAEGRFYNHSRDLGQEMEPLLWLQMGDRHPRTCPGDNVAESIKEAGTGRSRGTSPSISRPKAVWARGFPKYLCPDPSGEGAPWGPSCLELGRGGRKQGMSHSRQTPKRKNAPGRAVKFSLLHVFFL